MVPLDSLLQEEAVRHPKPKPSEALAKFMTETTRLLGHEIRDPMARRFNHDFKAAVRKHHDDLKTMGELGELRKLRDSLVFWRKKGVSNWE